MRGSERDVDGFLASCKEAADYIHSQATAGREIFVIGHNDADGVSSLGAAAGTLVDQGAKVTARSVFRLDELLATIPSGYGGLVLIVDMGGGSVRELEAKIGASDVVILDHHAPDSPETPPKWIHVNPHFHGIAGDWEISASGVTYLVMREVGKDSHRYAAMAVVGALGDLQDRGEKRRLVSLNEEIVKEAQEKSLLSVREDFLFQGSSSRPIHQAIASTHTPYLPGLTGDEAACLSLLAEAGIEVREGDRWRTLPDLSEEEKTSLYNTIVAFLAKSGYPTEVVRDLIATVYELVREDRSSGLKDAREFAQLLNACGKMSKAWLGVSIAMGYRGRLIAEAQAVLEQYRTSLRRGLEIALKNREMMHHTVIVRVGSEIDVRHVSSIASILSNSQLITLDRPLLVVGQEENSVKISARASTPLVEMGMNMGEIMREAASRFAGRGGGHKIAAGAEIPADRLTLFLLEVDRLVGDQLSRLKTQATLNGHL
jgi:single-stranded-DNA-specific exonuclease